MACGGQLSGLMMTAGTALLQNSGLLNSIGGFFDDVLGDTILGDVADFIGDVANDVSAWGQETFDDLVQMGGDIFPGLGDAIPNELFDDMVDLVAEGALTTVIDEWGEDILGTGDLGVFAQHLAQGEALVASTNVFLTSAIIDYAEEVVDPYINPITRSITGQLAVVNKAMPTFGTELAATGSIIDLGNLSAMGNPLGLVSNLQKQTGGLAAIEPALLAYGINPNSLNTALSNTNDVNSLMDVSVIDALGSGGMVFVDVESFSADELSGSTVKTTTPTLGGLALQGGNISLGEAVYGAMDGVKGSQLKNVQSMFGSDVKGVKTMQDLLDPSKLFPTSHASMTSVVFPEAGGGANSQFVSAQGLLDNTAKIYTNEV